MRFFAIELLCSNKAITLARRDVDIRLHLSDALQILVIEIMDITIQRGAEIALRSLSLQDRSKLQHAIELLQSIPQEELINSGKLRPQKVLSGEKIYVYRGTAQLRMILSYTDQIWTLEDIMDHARLDRLLAKRGQP